MKINESRIRMIIREETLRALRMNEDEDLKKHKEDLIGKIDWAKKHSGYDNYVHQLEDELKKVDRLLLDDDAQVAGAKVVASDLKSQYGSLEKMIRKIHDIAQQGAGVGAPGMRDALAQIAEIAEQMELAVQKGGGLSESHRRGRRLQEMQGSFRSKG